MLRDQSKENLKNWQCQNCKKPNETEARICTHCGALKSIDLQKREEKVQVQNFIVTPAPKNKHTKVASRVAKTSYLALLLSFFAFLYITISSTHTETEVGSKKWDRVLHSTEAKPASSTGSGNSIAEQKLWNPLKKLCIEEIREIQKAQSIRFANGSDTGNTCTPPVSYDQLIKVTIGSHWNAAFTPISELLDTTALNTKPFE